ncbi:hypothetical protein HDU96_008495 [Phlyctochytrium bullatum]|nr:hypothetical protein HDU96_008495 [Phlyctochytrium bullatum]
MERPPDGHRGWVDSSTTSAYPDIWMMVLVVVMGMFLGMLFIRTLVGLFGKVPSDSGNEYNDLAIDYDTDIEDRSTTNEDDLNPFSDLEAGSISDNIAYLDDDASKPVNDVSRPINDIYEKLASSEYKKALLEIKITESQAELHIAKEVQEGLEESNRSLRLTVEQLSATRDSEQDAIRVQLNRHKSEAAAAALELDRLLAAQVAETARAENALAERDRFRNKCADLEEKLRHDGDKPKTDEGSWRGKLSKLQDQLFAKDAELLETKNLAGLQASEIVDLTAALKAKSGQEQSSVAEVATLKSRCGELEVTKTALEQQLEDARAINQQVINRRDELQQSFDALFVAYESVTMEFENYQLVQQEQYLQADHEKVPIQSPISQQLTQTPNRQAPAPALPSTTTAPPKSAIGQEDGPKKVTSEPPVAVAKGSVAISKKTAPRKLAKTWVDPPFWVNPNAPPRVKAKAKGSSYPEFGRGLIDEIAGLPIDHEDLLEVNTLYTVYFDRRKKLQESGQFPYLSWYDYQLLHAWPSRKQELEHELILREKERMLAGEITRRRTPDTPSTFLVFKILDPLYIQAFPELQGLVDQATTMEMTRIYDRIDFTSHLLYFERKLTNPVNLSDVFDPQSVPHERPRGRYHLEMDRRRESRRKAKIQPIGLRLKSRKRSLSSDDLTYMAHRHAEELGSLKPDMFPVLKQRLSLWGKANLAQFDKEFKRVFSAACIARIMEEAKLARTSAVLAKSVEATAAENKRLERELETEKNNQKKLYQKIAALEAANLKSDEKLQAALLRIRQLEEQATLGSPAIDKMREPGESLVMGAKNGDGHAHVAGLKDDTGLQTQCRETHDAGRSGELEDSIPRGAKARTRDSQVAGMQTKFQTLATAAAGSAANLGTREADAARTLSKPDGRVALGATDGAEAGGSRGASLRLQDLDLRTETAAAIPAHAGLRMLAIDNVGALGEPEKLAANGATNGATLKIQQAFHSANTEPATRRLTAVSQKERLEFLKRKATGTRVWFDARREDTAALAPIVPRSVAISDETAAAAAA